MTREDFRVAAICGAMVWVGGILLGIVGMGIYMGGGSPTCP